MRARRPDPFGLLLAAAILLAGCDSAVSEPLTKFTFAGTSFAGEVDVRAHHAEFTTWPEGLPPFDGLYAYFADTPGGVPSLKVELVIPTRAWADAGTYECGTEPNHYMGDQAYCTITVTESPDMVNFGEWTTWMTPRPDGAYGPLPDCTITIGEVSPRFNGSVSCAGLAFWPVTGTHPDAGRTLALAGTFDVDPPR